jgi:multiple sugar transport system substrate-binding protein
MSKGNWSLIALVILSLIVLPGFGCRRSNVSGDAKNIQSLVVWGLWQESAMIEPIIKAFSDQTGVKVEYKKIASIATYEKTLLEALAQGRGPDVFVIHHTWVEDKRGIMTPAPSDIVDERAVREEFVDVVAKDVVRDGFVYALPTSVDTLALYYNRDLLSAAGIPKAPSTWDEFQRAIERVTKVNRLGIIEQSGASVGTAANVNRASDIVQLLMMQSGLDIMKPEIAQIDIANEIGERSVTFYTDFANKSKKVYTWNLQQDYSLDAFAAGKTAMMVNYSYHLPTIQAKNPRLNLGIAPVPQISDSQPKSFASYWPFAVSTTSRAPKTAWTFVRFLTSATSADALNAVQKVPPARRDSIATVQRDPLTGVFADQALLAVSWPRVDITASDAIFNKMIDDVVTGAASLEDALRSAQDQLQGFVKDPNAQP